jgi:hypothetical protein
MPDHLHLSLLESGGSSGQTTCRAEIWQPPEEGSDLREPVASLWFEVNGVGSLESDLSSFFPFALLLAMRAGKGLKVHGSLPARWKHGCMRFQEIASVWWSGCSPVAVDALWDAKPRGIEPAGEGLLFSADLDSFSALPQISPTHLIHVGSPTGGESTEALARAVAERLQVPLVTVIPGATFHGDDSIHPDDFPALRAAMVANLLAGNFGRITWPSPRNWNSPPGDGDHFALTDCFLPEGNVLRIAGRGATPMEKWTRVAAIPWARDLLVVCPRQPAGASPCGTCPSCLRARIALRAAGERAEWPGLMKNGPMDAAMLSACVEWDRDLCEEAHAILGPREGDSEITVGLGESLRRARLDDWARRLGKIRRDAPNTEAWPKLSRRLLPQVLATAERLDPAWLSSLADQLVGTGGSSDDG